MEPVATRGNRYSFVNILCYLIIVISSFNLIKSLIRLGSPERNIKAINPAAAERLSEWQLNFFEAAQSILQYQFLLSVISIIITVIAIILAAFAIKRSEWARKGLVAFFSFKAVMVVITFGFTFLTTHMLVYSVTARLKSRPGSAVGAPFEFFANLMALVAGIFAIAVLILYVWVIKRLRSETVKSQFVVYNP